MSWKPEIDELRYRQALAAKLGGEERVARHRAAGKRTVRERIDAFLDEDSFRELGSIAGKVTYDDQGQIQEVVPANFVMGRGTVDGRAVMLGGDDFTVRGGHSDAGIHRKQVYAEQLSRELRIPMVRFVDGSSGGGSVKTYQDEGRTYVAMLVGFEHEVAMLGEVPVVAAVLGSVVGLGAARAVATHFSVMVEGTSQVFVAGPPVVEHASHEKVDKEQLGGAQLHTRNGALDADGSLKLRRHVDLCDTFHVPVVSFVDQPGFLVGTEAERAGTIRHGASAIAALYQATVPWFTVIVRKAFGVGGGALVDRGDPDVRVAWPSGDWGSLPLKGGIEAAYRRQLEAAEDPKALREELLAQFEAVRSPLRTAENFGIEEIIDPRDTRPTLCEWVSLAYARLPHSLGPKDRGYRP